MEEETKVKIGLKHGSMVEGIIECNISRLIQSLDCSNGFISVIYTDKNQKKSLNLVNIAEISLIHIE